MQQNQSRGNETEKDQEQRAKTVVEMAIEDYKQIKKEIPELDCDQVLRLLEGATIH